MANKTTKLIALTICILMVVTVLVACTGGSSNRDYYVVIFKITGGKDRILRVEKDGVIGESFQATRAGYTINGWYTDELLSQPFDFDTPVTQDMVLYGKWIRNPEQYKVTFDLGIEGEDDVTITVEEGSSISVKSLPDCKKIGYYYRQWFVDEEMTIAWDFDADTVTGDMTLYADYGEDTSIVRDADGNIEYNNVVVNMYANWVFGTQDMMQKIIDDFNTEYNGKIKVVVSSATLNTSTQKDFALRYQQIPEINKDAQVNYYNAEAVLNLAGIEWNENEWYTEATRNCYVNGKLYSVPIAGAAPFLVYNKALMAKYKGSNALPSNYSELSALLQRAYAGEISAKPSFKSILTATDWTFREASSMIGYLQNGAQYYYLKDGRYVNDWGESNSTIYRGAVTGLSNMYNLFANGGACHGGNLTSEYNAYTAVKNGTALMAMINTPEFASEVLANSTVGVMPMSGLLAGDGVESSVANQVPIHTVGLQFYKASNVDLVQLAAAGVFADYASKKTVEYGQKGWFPLNKAIVESAKFQGYAVNKIGNPNNFRTLDGFKDEKNIVNTIAGETYMVSGVLAMANVTNATIEAQVYDLLAQIRAYLN